MFIQLIPIGKRIMAMAKNNIANCFQQGKRLITLIPSFKRVSSGGVGGGRLGRLATTCAASAQSSNGLYAIIDNTNLKVI
jgi:hypothetical protein